MPRKNKIRKSQRKREEPKEVLIDSNIWIIARAFILAIENENMTYRSFKKIQAIIDEKYWKPSWVPEKKING